MWGLSHVQNIDFYLLRGCKGLCLNISTAYLPIGGWWSKYSLYWFSSSRFSYFLWHRLWSQDHKERRRSLNFTYKLVIFFLPFLLPPLHIRVREVAFWLGTTWMYLCYLVFEIVMFIVESKLKDSCFVISSQVIPYHLSLFLEGKT